MTTLVEEAPTRRGHDECVLDRLSDRELEILRLMSDGLSNTAIAERLSVMERTIESHTARMFCKLGLPPGGQGNRRVLAVLTYLRSQ